MIEKEHAGQSPKQAAQERAALEQEMVLQGMDFPGLEPGTHVTFTEVDAALANAVEEPISVDAKLWRDWLLFLQGASTNGGLLIR